MVNGPRAARVMACVPHSASATTRTCRHAVRSPRRVAGRPNRASFSSLSGTSNVVPSTATRRQRPYQAPSVDSVAAGLALCSNSALSGSGPSSARAREVVAVVGTCHDPDQRLAHARPPASSRATSS